MNNDERSEPLDWDQVRGSLASARGSEYWRSLEQLAGTPEFQQWLDDEFPNRESLLGVDRRSFLKVMGASLALAGLAGCRFTRPEKIVPYVKAPEEIVPGKPLQYATAAPVAGHGVGVLVTSHMGRPTRIDGNPQHPASLGAADIFAQASLLDLYDPARLREVERGGVLSTWDEFAQDMTQALSGGGSLRILTGSVNSPSLEAQILRTVRRFPGARWHVYDPVDRQNVLRGSVAAFGAPRTITYRFDNADVVVSLDADFLASMPGSLRYARDFGARRAVRAGSADPVRLYSIESSPTITGAAADHRLSVRASEVPALARSLAAAVDPRVATLGAPSSIQWLQAVASDLKKSAGRCVVLAGDSQPEEVHVLAHAMNEALGNVGKTVVYAEPMADPAREEAGTLRELVDDMAAGRVAALLIIGGNPAYCAPVDFEFASHLRRVPVAAYLGLARDETASLCRWALPATHYLEAWGDIRAFDGTVTVQQPLIEPLYEGRSSYEVLSGLSGRRVTSLEAVRAHWRAARPALGKRFDAEWRRWIHNGVVPGTACEPVSSPVLPTALSTLAPPPTASDGVEVVFRPDPTVWDGTYTGNAWLQELPKPLTKLTWDNALLLSPAMARRMKLASRDVVAVRAGGRQTEAAVWILPGHPDRCATLHLGYGRTAGGPVAKGFGANAYAIRTSDRLWYRSDAEIVPLRRSYLLVATQDHHAIDAGEVGNMHGRDIVREGTIGQFRADPSLAPHGSHPKEAISLYEDYPYPDHKWGMTVDLSSCTGCNACVIACQAENNIPVVGKDEVSRGREMHWIRIDRYFKGDPDSPSVVHQPVMCMHCEKAPCEPVCPVAATVHSHDGLNQMVYNRCVGTRYCSNNCPYKVRRFNFFKYSAGQPHNAPGNFDIPSLKLIANPNVTIRGRGVMEKCTFCVQRISAARIEAKKAGRPIADGEIVTACQQACPTRAITFGDLNDPRSRVSDLQKQPHRYALLEDLNTRPRLTYLARVSNPNPEVGERS